MSGLSRRSLYVAVTVAAAAAVSAAVLFAAVSPLSTADLWFHLTMGEVYATQGLWPQGDPVLFTAASRPPVQHEWLFGVFVFLVKSALGLGSLRVVEGILVAGLILLFLAVMRSATRDVCLVAVGTLVAVTLSSLRLVQLRPDLISIGATLLLVRLIIDPRGGPSPRAIAAASVLCLLWVNVHSLFAIGLVLIGAACVGAVVETSQAAAASAADEPAPSGPNPAARLRRLLAALGIILLVTVCNPRGLAQHLTFFTSSQRSPIWGIIDEWYPFNPFLPQPPYNSPALPPLLWGVADLVILLFVATFLIAYRNYRRSPSRRQLEQLDPVGFIVGAAAIGAILISFRFLWLGILPLRYAVVFWSRRPRGTRSAEGLIAAAAICVVALFPTHGGYLAQIADVPRSPRRWLTEPFNKERFSWRAVRFLKTAGVRGNLFNPYVLGGILGYELAPQVRIFIDGRTEHYPMAVLMDRAAVIQPRPHQRPSPLEILDTYEVDLFLGTGGSAYGYEEPDTRRLLEGASGWILVYRTMDHSIYARRGERGAENVRRIADYWRERRVPFDAECGFDPDRVIRARPDWAREEGLLPADFDRYLEAARGPDSPARAEALGTVGKIYGIAGAYEETANAYRQAEAIAADKAPLRRGIAAVEEALARRRSSAPARCRAP